jgi:phospholipase C
MGVLPPVSGAQHPNLSKPSVLETVHASKVANLPLRNSNGSYDQHTPPDLSSSAAISDYIQTRTAAWTQHLGRQRKRGEATPAKAASTSKVSGAKARNKKRPAKSK